MRQMGTAGEIVRIFTLLNLFTLRSRADIININVKAMNK